MGLNGLNDLDDEGFTVWSRKQDGTLRTDHVDELKAAVDRALQPL